MSTITKAVIAAGGWSTRFLPAVKIYAKQLVPMLNKPQIQWVVEELVAAGITDIAIIHRHGETSLRRYFAVDPELDKYLESTNKTHLIESLKILQKNVHFRFIPQYRHLPYGNASPALAAKTFIGSDSFVYVFGDDMAIEDKPGTFVKQLIDTFQKNQADAVAAVQQVPWEEIDRYGAILFDKNDPDRIRGVFEKVPRDQAPSNYTQWGRFIASAKIIKNIQKQSLAVNHELWWADAIHHLSQTGKVLAVKSPPRLWMTTGDPLNQLKATLVLALKHPDYQKSISDFIKTL